MLANVDKVLRVSNTNRGFVTPELLRAAGLPRSVIEGGTKQGWRRIHRGLWFVQEREMNLHDWIQAALMLGGSSSGIGGGASLFIRGILTKEPAYVDLWVPPDQTISRIKDSPLRFHRDHLNRLGRRDTNGPLLSIVDSLKDFVDFTSDATEAASAIINARRKSPRFDELIRDSVFDRTKQKHRKLMEELITCYPAYDSVLEYLWVANVERPHRIRPSTRQWKCPDGYVRDGVWEDLFTIYELDGDAYHLNPQTLKRDSEKDYKARRRGYRTLRFGYADVVHNACATAASLITSIPGLEVSPCGSSCWMNLQA